MLTEWRLPVIFIYSQIILTTSLSYKRTVELDSRHSLSVLTCRGSNFNHMVAADKGFQPQKQEGILRSEVSSYLSVPFSLGPLKPEHWKINWSYFWTIIVIFKGKNPTVSPSLLTSSAEGNEAAKQSSRVLFLSLPPRLRQTPHADLGEDIKCKIKQGNEGLSLRLEALWKWLIDLHQMEELPSLLGNAQ